MTRNFEMEPDAWVKRLDKAARAAAALARTPEAFVALLEQGVELQLEQEEPQVHKYKVTYPEKLKEAYWKDGRIQEKN